MGQEKCRVFVPKVTSGTAPKRKRSAQSDLNNNVQRRKKVFNELWNPLEDRITTITTRAYDGTIEDIDTFCDTEAFQYRNQHVVPTGLVVTGPSLTSRSSFFGRLRSTAKAAGRKTLIILNSGSCPNLKALLREVTRAATGSAIETSDDVNDTKTETRLFDYDLESLRQQLSKTPNEHVIVAFQDSEAFESSTIVQAVNIVHSWLDRIPFVLLFGIGTYTDTFQERLPASTLRVMKGQKFEIAETLETLETLFLATTESPEIRLRLGPELASKILRQQLDHFQSLDTFRDAVQYAYMSHFYANSTSIMLADDITYNQLPKNVVEAIRNLPSYRKWAERQLSLNDHKPVQKSLESDEFLFDLTKEHLESSNEALASLSTAAACIAALRSCNQQSSNTPIPRSELYIRAMNSELANSPLFRDTMMFVRKASSDVLGQIFSALFQLNAEAFPINTAKYRDRLEELLTQNPDVVGPLRSYQNENVRATVVSQKVQLSKHKGTLSKTDAAYSEILEAFYKDLSNFLGEALIDPRDLFPHEILVYDLKSPHTDVFQPRPRFALERALYSPHDYLNCDCCPSLMDKSNDADNALAPTQPVTSILYQLYLESGSLINVSDLWSAYYAIVGTQDEEEDEEELARHQALFQRSLAELRYLGIVKSTKKKADHIAKATWRGL